MNCKIIDNKQFELSQKLKEKISELSLSYAEKTKLENVLLSYDDLSDIKLEKPLVESKRKNKNLNIRLNRTILESSIRKFVGMIKFPCQA